jgi:hypothetical protein
MGMVSQQDAQCLKPYFEICRPKQPRIDHLVTGEDGACLAESCMTSALAAGGEHVSPPLDGAAKPLHFFKVAPASCPIAAKVVCAAFNPSRKSLSEYAEYLSVA